MIIGLLCSKNEDILFLDLLFLKTFQKEIKISMNFYKKFSKNLKLKGVANDNSQVNTAYYSTKIRPPSKHGKHVIEEEEETECGTPIASDFQAPIAPDFQTPIIHSQLRVLNKDFFIDMVAWFNEFKSSKNKEKRKSYHATFDQKEKYRVKRKWKEKMHQLQKHILFFDFIENYYVPKKYFKKQFEYGKKIKFC